MVEQCLVKDPAVRPSAAELLSYPFFRSVKKESYLVGTVLSNFFSHSKNILANLFLNYPIRIFAAADTTSRTT